MKKSERAIEMRKRERERERPKDRWGILGGANTSPWAKRQGSC